MAEPEEGKCLIIPEKNPLKTQDPWAPSSKQRTPKASITFNNQMTAKYYSTIGATPCATIAAYHATRDQHADSGSGMWTTASKDLSTLLEAIYHPEIN